MIYLEVGLPGALMLCFEWWLFEVLAIFAGLMGVEMLAAEVIIVNLASFVFMIPLGCSFAASAFTGYFTASGKIAEGKKYTRLTILFNSLLTLIMLLLVYVFQKQIASFFTKEEKVVAIIEDCMTVLYFYFFFDTIHGVQSGIIRGLGR